MTAPTHSRPLTTLLVFTTVLLPLQQLRAAGPQDVSQPGQVRDIALASGGTLAGQIVDSKGMPLAHQRVGLRHGDESIESLTDESGRFSFAGLRGGVYELSVGESSVACRCWTANAAPPGATDQLLVVTGKGVHRGQRPIADFLSGPVLIGLIIAAAIAIPIAVHNSQKSAS